MRGLKNTVEVERRCTEEDDSVYITQNVYGRLMVKSIECYERTMQKMYEAKKVIEGLNDVKAGKTVDGDIAVANIRKNLSNYVSTI